MTFKLNTLQCSHSRRLRNRFRQIVFATLDASVGAIPRRQSALPHIIFTSNKTDLKPEALQFLLKEAVPGTTPSTDKIKTSLVYSLVCIAAYTPIENVSTETVSKALKNSIIHPHTRSIFAPLMITSKPKILVGFVRAVSDASLVATLHDLAVIPDLQGLGLGRKLLEQVTKELSRKGIIDVGVLAPQHSERFFERCRFGDDTEGSTPMVLTQAGEMWALESKQCKKL